jgi:predicted transcriptional regulator of viral defense system
MPYNPSVMTPRGRPAEAQQIVVEFAATATDRVLNIPGDVPRIQEIARQKLDREIGVHHAVARLQEHGQLHRMQRGRYLYTTRPAPNARLMSLDPVADAVLRDLNVPYYLSWHSALWHYGLIDQQSRTIYVALPRRGKRNVSMGQQRVRFVYVSDADKFFGGERSEEFEWPVWIARPEKALIDSLDRPRLAAPVPVVVDGLRRAHEERLIVPEHLVEDALAFNSPHLNRRLGFWMDMLGIPGTDELALRLGRGPAIPLDARYRYDAGERPPANRRWLVYEDPSIVGPAMELK